MAQVAEITLMEDKGMFILKFNTMSTDNLTHCIAWAATAVSKLSQKTFKFSCFASQIIINIKFKKKMKTSSQSSSKVVCFGQMDWQ